ncbi:hypothetical protein POM88_053133 [Heracleum sosnowskyi]|uniref:SH2 domain-containing protein n=1 Tax=Heracleum sosnowskyi TaxID=360622 RepID=A0AAD8GPL8_9APIA|nr:hypothetical protein POM88_053133 [Heracleum sosnowskyi]
MPSQRGYCFTTMDMVCQSQLPTANGEIWLFNKLQDCTFTSSSAGTPARDCILLAACEAHETLPHSVEFPADIFTSCLTTPFKMRIMRSANCSPISHPMLPTTHQHHMWDAWDMAAEICLSQLPGLVEDPNAEFQVSFEVSLDHESELKKPPEQLPIVLQSRFLSIQDVFITGIGAFAENCWMPRISAKGLQDPGTFVLRFPTSRSWPHPDADNLVVTYVRSDYNIHHKLLSLDSIYRICCGGIQVICEIADVEKVLQNKGLATPW